MKRTALLAVLVPLTFAAGMAAEKAAMKFPWAGEELNKPCGKTMLEWKCAQHHYGKPPASNPKLPDMPSVCVLREFSVTPMEDGLVVHANYTEPNPRRKLTPSSFLEMAERIRRYWIAKEFAPLGEDWSKLSVLLYLDGKLVATRNAAGTFGPNGKPID